LKAVGVVVRLAEQAAPAPGAREEERARGRRGGRVGREEARHVLGRGGRVAHVEADGLPLAEQRPHGDRAPLGVGADDVADEPVAGRVGRPQRRRRHADVQRPLHELAVGLGQLLVELAQDLERRPPVDPLEEVHAALRDRHGLADRPAPLGHDGVERHRPAERHPHGPAREEPLVEEQRVVAPPGRQAAHLQARRPGVVEPLEQRARVHARGVAEEQEPGQRRGARRDREPGGPLARARVLVGEVLALDVEGVERHVGQDARP
jgi:hypothetical protein